MRIELTNKKGSFKITELAQSFKWSGDSKQAARRFDINFTRSATDKSIPTVDTSCGALVKLKEDNGNTLFDGYLVDRSMNTESSALTLTCLDRGWHLKGNDHICSFENKTPEEITTSVLAVYGVKVGTLAKTGVKISRKFLNSTSIYDIITTVYTLASQQTGEKYHIGFIGDKLTVTIKRPTLKTLIIQGKSNLIAANVTESIESIISEVSVYNKDGNLVKTFSDKARISDYGKLSKIIKQSDKDNKFAEAETKLKDGGLAQKITVDSLGNTSCISGGCVFVKEALTGIYGLFYIDNDVHEWKGGQYYNKFVLNFQKTMNEKEVGEAIKEK